MSLHVAIHYLPGAEGAWEYSQCASGSFWVGRFGHIGRCFLRSLVPNGFLHQPQGVNTVGLPRFGFLFDATKELYGILELVSINNFQEVLV